MRNACHQGIGAALTFLGISARPVGARRSKDYTCFDALESFCIPIAHEHGNSQARQN